MLLIFLILFVMYIFLPTIIGILIAIIPIFKKKQRVAVFLISVLFMLSIEIGYLHYLQLNPIIEYDNKEISDELASAIINEAVDKNLGVDDFGSVELSKYVFIIKYKIHREHNSIGTLEVYGFPFGEDRKNIYFDDPISFFNR